MEPTFYEDLCDNRNRRMKRNLTLDLGGKCEESPTSALLSTPDVKEFKMSTPDVEQLCGRLPEANFVFADVTGEQEMYAKGFEKALSELQYSDSTDSSSDFVTLDLDSYPASLGFGNPGGLSVSHQPTVNQGPMTFSNQATTDQVPMTSSNRTTSDDQEPMTFHNQQTTVTNQPTTASSRNKNDPQAAPNVLGPRLPSPLDMSSQERYKYERKRLRNRIAAQKCRQKKLANIALLEAQVQGLRDENQELTTVASKLREEVRRLEDRVVSHRQSGCKFSYPQPQKGRF